MGKETQKADTKENSVLNTILAPENEERMEGLRPEKVNTEEMIKARMSLLDIALVRDPSGPIIEKRPTMRDPETHKQIYMELRFRQYKIPNHEVLFYTGSVITDYNASHQETIEIGGKRLGFAFDRTYLYRGRLYTRCVWAPDEPEYLGLDHNIPEKVAAAGLLFCKMIDRRSRQPIAVLKRQLDGRTPMYQIVGGKEMEPRYRDLKRVFENFFIKRGGPIDSRDEGLSNFMYDAISPISEEVSQ